MNQLTHQKVNFQQRLTCYDHAENIKIEKIYASTKTRLLVNPIQNSKKHVSTDFFNLRLQYTFTSAIFFKFGFLGQISSRRIISNFQKKNLRRQNIGGKIGILRILQK